MIDTFGDLSRVCPACWLRANVYALLQQIQGHFHTNNTKNIVFGVPVERAYRRPGSTEAKAWTLVVSKHSWKELQDVCLLIFQRAKCKLKIYGFRNGFPLSYFLCIFMKLHRLVVWLTQVGEIRFAPVNRFSRPEELCVCVCECEPCTVIFQKHKCVNAWRGSGWVLDYSGCFLKMLLHIAASVSKLSEI